MGKVRSIDFGNYPSLLFFKGFMVTDTTKDHNKDHKPYQTRPKTIKKIHRQRENITSSTFQSEDGGSSIDRNM